MHRLAVVCPFVGLCRSHPHRIRTLGTKPARTMGSYECGGSVVRTMLRGVDVARCVAVLAA
jgi:hypothetical protein